MSARLLAVFLLGVLTPAVGDGGAPAAKAFILKSSTRDLEEFRAFAKVAARLKKYGSVQIDIGVLADKSWHEMPAPWSPWHEYATTHGALYKFYPHPKIAPFVPAEWVARNRELLLGKAAILRELGLEAAFSSNDTHFLPEAFFRKYPHWRGPRVDHPRRSRQEEFAWCVDQAETLEMIEWMAAELKRAVPEIRTITSLNNDSGSGLCWSAALYSGPNGPAGCRSRHVGQRMRGLLEAIHRGFERGGGSVVTRVHGNFWQGEDEIVAAHLPPDSYLDSKDRSAIRVATLAVEAYPVLGLVNPLEVFAALERYNHPATRTVFVGTGPFYNRFDEPIETASRMVDLIEDYLDAPSQGLLARLEKTRSVALKYAGEENMKRAFEGFYRMDAAFRLKHVAAPRYSNLYCGVSMRHLTRPLVIRPDLLTREEEAYFLPYVFNIHESEARNDYTDLHGSPYSGPSGWNEAGVRQALASGIQAAEQFENLKGAPQKAWFDQLGLSMRMWVSEVRSIHNFYFAQKLRERNAEAVTGAPRVHAKLPTWTGDADFIEWTQIQRDELDNAEEFAALLARGGVSLIGHARDARYQDTFLLGPDLVKDVRRKAETMRAHWLDVQKYLAPPHK